MFIRDEIFIDDTKIVIDGNLLKHGTMICAMENASYFVIFRRPDSLILETSKLFSQAICMEILDKSTRTLCRPSIYIDRFPDYVYAHTDCICILVDGILTTHTITERKGILITQYLGRVIPQYPDMKIDSTAIIEANAWRSASVKKNILLITQKTIDGCLPLVDINILAPKNIIMNNLHDIIIICVQA